MVMKRRDEGAISISGGNPTLEFLFLPEFLLVRNILVFGCFAHICVDF